MSQYSLHHVIPCITFIPSSGAEEYDGINGIKRMELRPGSRNETILVPYHVVLASSFWRITA